MIAGINIYSAPATSIQKKVEKIDSLLIILQQEVNELKSQVKNVSSVDSQKNKPQKAAQQPIASELLSRRQKALWLASGSSYHNIAVGYSMTGSIPFGFCFLHKFEKWGYKAEAGMIWSEEENISSGGARLNLIRSLHIFDLFDTHSLQFHLYSLGGTGFRWEERQYPQYTTQPNASGTYEIPDRQMEVMIGAGTEISLPFTGGFRLAPELRYIASYYLNRFQDSQTWKAQSDSQKEERPEKNFGLEYELGFNFYFYFK
ncbi:MAG: hypothetical protein HQK83_09630 [Fibrobacteria bacterium]|nr:hypothetical protein [Fibrobacteria bacterium]